MGGGGGGEGWVGGRREWGRWRRREGEGEGGGEGGGGKEGGGKEGGGEGGKGGGKGGGGGGGGYMWLFWNSAACSIFWSMGMGSVK